MTHCLFECKTKRMTVGAKSVLDDLASLQKDLRKLAEAVVQVYETAIDYENDLYPQLKFKEKRNVYLLVATLEEWYLFGDKTQVLLDQEVKAIFIERGIDQSYLKKYPYFIVAAENIELLADLLNKKSIDEIFAPKMSDPDKHMWHIRTYLLDEFANDFGNINNPFEAEYNQFLDETIEKMK